MLNLLPPWHTAHTMLQQFDCADSASIELAIAPETLRQAVLTVAHHSDYQMLGICADTLSQAIASLQAYTQAIGYDPPLPSNSVAGTVYLKFNPRSGLCYVDSYIGQHRGVLVSCQSADEAGINHTYGHLPLDLFG